MALTGRWSSKPSNKHRCASCPIAFILWYASFHGCTPHTSCWGKGHVHIRDLFVSPRMFWCNCLGHFTFNQPPVHRWPVIQNTAEILSILDLREPDEKRHDAGKCHIRVTDWNAAARIHYSVPNRPTGIILSWTLPSEDQPSVASPQQVERITAATLGWEKGKPIPACQQSPWKCVILQAACLLFASRRIRHSDSP